MANDREDHMLVTIQCAQYCWEFLFNLRPILEELRLKCKELPIICWSDVVKLFTLSKINERKLLRTSKNKKQYDPECLVDAIARIVRENLVNSFELIVFTDGSLSRKVADTLKMRLESSCFYHKIVKVRVVLCESDNNLDSVDPYFLNVFNGIPIIFTEARNFYEASFEKEIYSVQLQSKIQSKNGLDFLDELGRYFTLQSGDYCFREGMREILNKIFRKLVRKLKFMNTLTLKPPRSRQNPERFIRRMMEANKWTELKKYYKDTLNEQMLMIQANKMRKLYTMLEEKQISIWDFYCFVPSCMYREEIRDRLMIKNVQEESYKKDMSDIDRTRICSIASMDPDSPVIHIGYHIQHVYVFFNFDGKMREDPFSMLSAANLFSLNENITCYEKAKEYQKLETNVDDNKKGGILLYNFVDKEGNDLYNNKLSELYGEKTKLDDAIFSIIQLLANDVNVIGENDGVAAIALLFILYCTDKVQNNAFIKKCVRYTILRISLVFKCNLPILSHRHPYIPVRIHDALMYALYVSATDLDPKENYYQRLGQSGPYFMCMMETIFSQKLPQNVNFRDWLAWHYLHKGYEEYNGRYLLDSIPMTKIQDWVFTTSGPLIIKGKESDTNYHEFFKDMTAIDIFKLKEFIQNGEKPPKDFNFRWADITISGSVPSTNSDFLEENYFYKHVRVCKSTCRPLVKCCHSHHSWKVCLPKQYQAEHLSFYNLFGKYVVQEHSFPNPDELMSFLARNYPDKLFYRNTPEIVRFVVESFSVSDLKPEVFIERFTNSKDPAKRIRVELSCFCAAHNSSSSFGLLCFCFLVIMIIVYIVLIIALECFIVFIDLN